ncbi:MAG TPA: deoxyribose-phosphate aldolase [Paludibacteraceae bacterium]|jgi:deoxyribose-phosphate aldolase|nr:deoxyribose-phosphate aldolase [Paludibacteraceae bacterium]HOS36946.1 deoxyribose-phosphate aldolase [Paludibacteraceae bacterium]HPK21086.1 deoxyribose-phosphate aldolase [Paludibacteraceae bacterium]HPW95740.1 deoxyribose-phosphate aldolase [Paludibacteraceae bacterium]HRR59080.1 deoxyribose-phosphate aldolase [Paludibacteraceae bacterium]
MEKMKELYAQYNCDLKDADVKAAVEAILAKDFAKNNTVEVYKKCLNSIDLTSLLGTDTEEKIAEMMRKVNDFPKKFPKLPNVAAVCVYPSLVPVTREVLNKNNGVNIAAVAACFPASQSFIEVKVAETALTVKAGADEIDVVISLGKFMSGAHSEVYDELSELKAACKNAHLKVILESGSLRSAVEIKQASLLAMAAGADFIKTSTGKTEPAATLEAAYVMCGAIKEYYKKTGIKVGFKPAGGVSTTEEAVQFYTVVKAILGDEWMNNKLFRFGASRLANNLLSSIEGKEVKYF